MKNKVVKIIVIVFLFLLSKQFGLSQSFLNLDFESANLSGYSPGSHNVPINAALLGWNGYFVTSTTTNQATQVWYDDLSSGGAAISVNDTNNGFGPAIPLQGKYSVYLFGGSGNVSATISQTGSVPVGTKSLLMDVNQYFGFVVTLGGQTVNMVPLQLFSNYTLYGGDISAYSGQLVQLTITAPPTSTPNAVLLDNIVFSSSAVPEPNTLGLTILGGLLFGFPRWRKFLR